MWHAEVTLDSSEGSHLFITCTHNLRALQERLVSEVLYFSLPWEQGRNLVARRTCFDAYCLFFFESIHWKTLWLALGFRIGGKYASWLHIMCAVESKKLETDEERRWRQFKNSLILNSNCALLRKFARRPEKGIYFINYSSLPVILLNIMR